MGVPESVYRILKESLFSGAADAPVMQGAVSNVALVQAMGGIGTLAELLGALAKDGLSVYAGAELLLYKAEKDSIAGRHIRRSACSGEAPCAVRHSAAKSEAPGPQVLPRRSRTTYRSQECI